MKMQDVKKLMGNKSENDLLQEGLGFDRQFTGKSGYLINKDGTYNINKKGALTSSFYEYMIHSSWWVFILNMLSYYILTNAFFAILFMLNGVDHLSGIEDQGIWNNFVNTFFFSLQTFTTVGYGHIHPDNYTANIIAGIGAFVGLMGFALATGLFFARFARPKVNIKFSKNILIAPFEKGKSIQFRVVNVSNTKLINLQASITATWLEMQPDGLVRRKFQRLDLALDSIYLFPLNWTIVHPLDKKSPFANLSLEDLRRNKVEFIVMIRGYDDTYGQQIHKSSSYQCRDILDEVQFLPMYESTEEGTILHLDKLDDVKQNSFDD